MTLPPMGVPPPRWCPVPQPVQRLVLRNARALLPRQEQAVLLDWESSLLERLAPPPRALESLGPFVGAVGLEGPPQTVLTGVCQAGLGDEVAWLERGPTLETIHGVDLAAAVAKVYGARLQIWIIDHEYGLVNQGALSHGGDRKSMRQSYEAAAVLGQALAARFSARYPSLDVEVRRTADPGVQTELFALVLSRAMGELYPRGVRLPFNNHDPSLWNEYGFLACVALAAFESLARKRTTWAVLDHDQLRPTIGGIQLARDAPSPSVGALFYWPVPSALWRASRGRPAPETWLHQLHTRPRRMFRAKGNPLARIHIGDDAARLAHHFAPYSQELGQELLAYAGAPEGCYATREEFIGTFTDRLKALAGPQF